MEKSAPSNFIESIIEKDRAAGKYGGDVVTRFPPEPNGYLHIGHAKSICLNFGLAQKYNGTCHLRFDDTNPTTEDPEFVESIQADIAWLGFKVEKHLYFASDYFEKFYQIAQNLVRAGKAYVDSHSLEEMREYRGTVKEAGRPSPFRDRSVEENLDLLARMRAGEFEDGAHVLRAKIDMANNNMKMRDPLLYRIRKAHHYRVGDDWAIYPMYDFAHPLEDAIEGITHSICTLEFDNNRAVYDWVLDNGWPEPRPYQYEFARLNLDYTVMSKRKLKQLVEEKLVAGWDDPRMPTVAGMRRRGITPEAIRTFSEEVGVAKADNQVDLGIFEAAVRNDLNYRAKRVMAVLDPIKVILTNYENEKSEFLSAPYWPSDFPKDESRMIPFSNEIWIERADFMENPSKKFRRLSVGQEVRLRYAYIIKCTEVKKDDAGNITEIHCTYDPDSASGGSTSSRKVKGTIHWVSADKTVPATVRLYDRLFKVANPDDVEDGKTFKDHINADSLTVLPNAFVEPAVKDAPAGTHFQFERNGFFITDSEDSKPDKLVFNRIITLRDTWKNKSNHAEIKTSRVVKTKKGEIEATAPKAADEALAGRLMADYGVSETDAAILSGNEALVAWFESSAKLTEHKSALAGWVSNEIVRILKSESLKSIKITPKQLANLVDLIEAGTVAKNIAKKVFAGMIESGNDAETVIENKGLKQLDDSDAIRELVEQVVATNPQQAEAYRGGKTNLKGFFMGQTMRASGGKANPGLVAKMIAEVLG